MELCLRFSELDIEHWAERYIQCQKLSSRQWEETLIDRKDHIRKCEAMTLDELIVRYFILEVAMSIKASS